MFIVREVTKDDDFVRSRMFMVRENERPPAQLRGAETSLSQTLDQLFRSS